MHTLKCTKKTVAVCNCSSILLLAHLVMLLEMCAISTEDAYTRPAAEDICKFLTLSQHENYLPDDFDEKKSEKGDL